MSSATCVVTGFSRSFAFVAALALCGHAAAAEEVNLYTTREPALIQPLLEAFNKSSGVKVNTVFLKDGMLERVKAEGTRSPADVLMAVDIGNLVDLVEGGGTQPVKSAVLEQTLPSHLRDAGGQWFALSLRDRVIYVEKDSKLDKLTYEDLADPKFKGKVCIRAGQHPHRGQRFFVGRTQRPHANIAGRFEDRDR